MMVAASVVLASPTPFKRGINCPSTDKDGTALTASSSFADSDGNEFAQCTYPDAGPCAYFFADGSFSSGSSTCPKGLPQDDASNSPASAGSTTASTNAAAGAIDPSIVCPATDKDGTALTQSSSFKDDEGNEFAQCTYKDAGPCAFFFADGSFSSGSSTCPKGLPQTSGSSPAGTTTQAPPPVTSTTQAAPPPPPVTTTSTQAAPPPPPPPATTSSTDALSTSTSTFFSTVEPATSSSAAPPAPPATTTAAAVTMPPAQPPATTDDTDSDPTTTFVYVTATASAGGGAVANNAGLGEGSTNAAVGRGLARGAGSVLAALPLVLVLGALF
ncbi:hypothetical protein C8F04DRAFT_1270028 [Mycena alexandri]|uniref:Uncharacterized protein n=1 Tax=Mycena alexandri TaxID=1745969 RepID=A0AAD6SEL3_9AGAR|nr:hypothetical protein C8F04DRAFT_1270028 [Mycena alexandri]